MFDEIRKIFGFKELRIIVICIWVLVLRVYLEVINLEFVELFSVVKVWEVLS